MDDTPDRGFLIWKILSDLRIIFYIRELVRNVPINLVVSTTDAIGRKHATEKSNYLIFP